MEKRTNGVWLKFTLTVSGLNVKRNELFLTDKNCKKDWPTRLSLYQKNLTDYVTLLNDGDTKKKVNNITKENYKQLQLIASRCEQKKQRTLSSRSFALTLLLVPAYTYCTLASQ